MEEYIINLAPTGMIPLKNENPHLPVTPLEIATECVKAASMGVSMFHIHARESDGTPSYKKAIYSEIISLIRDLNSEPLLVVSTSGRLYNDFEKRSEVLELSRDLKPDMASLTLGSINFFNPLL